MKKITFYILTLLSLISCGEQFERGGDISINSSSIVGGEVVEKGELPSVVALIRNGDFHCSGVLIATDIVLSAAHCVIGETSASLKIYVGDGVSKPADKEFVRGQYKISKISLHPGIKIEEGRGIINLGDFDANDVAIIFLKDKIENVEIYPVLSDLFELKENLQKMNLTTVVGYGYNKEEVFGTRNDGLEYGLKRKVEIPIRDFDNHEVDIRQQGKDSCYIDSGGPVFLEVNGKKTIFALVSGSNGFCAENEFPVYYSMIFDSACWIAKETGLSLSDIQRNCERNDLIAEKCSLGTKKEQNKCAKNLSELIFKTQILE